MTSSGCSHYKRNCKFFTPCCQKIYSCRLCHDEKEIHILNRKSIKEIICAVCSTRQRVQKQCQNCGTIFGKYYCPECNLFDDEDKGQFHCAGCGICRIGGSVNFFHCETCNACLSIQLVNKHKCIEDVLRSGCPVCVEDLHSSTRSLVALKCGHVIHQQCLKDLETSGYSKCPLCTASFHS